MPGTRFSLEVQPRIPPELQGLEQLAENLIYSWDRGVRGLFFRLDAELWERCGHNPKLFLRRVGQDKLAEAAADVVFLQHFRGVMSAHASYFEFSNRHVTTAWIDGDHDLVSYACAEFGLHESLPIYSGGLGILAGDYCKAMSDMDVPFVAVGILYRRGYFNQTIDADGNQIATYAISDFEDLPVQCALCKEGNPLVVSVRIANREVMLRVWVAHVGLIRLYLLDSDIEQNSIEDRGITYQLYGGGDGNRIRQEIVLGIGGVRAQRALGLAPTVWHINEGHAAFQVVERCRELVAAGLDFASALEAVAANTVFTTHTPVAAGHDVFDHSLLRDYLADHVAGLKISMDEFLALGASPGAEHRFNMTALALRGSRFHNGVSQIHGNVASSMEGYIWPQIDAAENPIRHVTNGVHVPTFLAREWVNYFNQQFGGSWRNELLNPDYWHRIDDIPDHVFWSQRENFKATMVETLIDRIDRQLTRNGYSKSQIDRSTRYLRRGDRSVMMVGFARRFATYKRATLIFSDEARLARLLNNPERPVIFIFAGKAHPNDQPGQDLIRAIHHYSRKPEFEGKILLVENYDVAMARKLVSGVDVWLNTPQYPLEASGTSGQKAAINGVLNLSVLDGWWAEGYDGVNGWGITPHGPRYSQEFRDREEAGELLDLLERQVVPLYFERNNHGYSRGWVARAKAAMKTIIPRFNSQRMVADYLRDHYAPAIRQGRRLQADNWNGAKALAAWKQKITAGWPAVKVHREDVPQTSIYSDTSMPIQVAVALGSLAPADIVVDCMLGVESADGEFSPYSHHALSHRGNTADARTLFAIDLKPEMPGLLSYMVRVYPHHELLSHPFEMGRMLWV
ncbi:MAG: alpha-glucan family phosphorylase [Porticoccaceae bacterium]